MRFLMSKHDSWVRLRKSSPYEALLELFPQGFPVRDPFPMHTSRTTDGQKVALWTIEIDRLNGEQVRAIAYAIAHQNGADPIEVLDEAIALGSFGLDERWIKSLEMGAEGYARTLELRNFMLTNPLITSGTSQAMRDFMQSQVERWIEGDEVPPPLPTEIDEVPEDLRSPELVAAIRKNKVNKLLTDGNYSAFDILTGRAMVEVLNEMNPEDSYELGSFDELGDDE